MTQTFAAGFCWPCPRHGDALERSVIYILSHDADGAMGFIVNQPAEGITLGEIAQNLPDSVASTGLTNLPVFIGGPVQNDNGFVLYSVEEDAPDELPVGLTQSMDILVEAAGGRGPRHMRLLLGYASWGPGQLEGEIQENAWLICPATLDDVFAAEPDDVYRTCATRLGIDLTLLSQMVVKFVVRTVAATAFDPARTPHPTARWCKSAP